MLLNTQALLDKAPDKVPYGRPSIVNPATAKSLPIEFKDKVGSYQFDQPYVVELDNVELAGPICVCFWGDDIVLDVAYFGRLDTWDRNRTYFNQAIESRNRFEMAHLEQACSLLGVWSGNYFHWTLEILPMLEGVLHLSDEIVFLVEHRPQQWVFDSLRHIGAKHIQPIQSMYHQIDKLYVPTARRRDGRTSPDSIDFLRKSTPQIEPWDYEKIYISRKDATNRQVANESEVIEFLAGKGFTPVAFDGMRWKDQIGIAKGAHTVVAPHGAGLVNMVYNQDRPTIIELATPEYLNPCFYTMAAAMGSEHRLLVGEPMAGENIQIDLEALDAIL